MKKCFKVKEHTRDGVVVKEHIRCIDDKKEVLTLEKQREGLTYREFWDLKREGKLAKPLAEHIADKLISNGYNATIDHSAKSESMYVKVYHEGVYTKIRVSGHNNSTSYMSDYNISNKSSLDTALKTISDRFKIK